MKYAIVSVTEEGQKLANELAADLNNDPTVINVDVYHKNVIQTLNNSFTKYDCWIGIMATGIMIRSVCPLLKSKLNDPAVLVAGENRKHVISLLSGHLGGANQFAIKIAGIIGAIPVITTATDLQGKMGIDALAHQYWFDIDKPQFIKDINLHLASHGKADLCLPTRLGFLENHPIITRSYNLEMWDKSFIKASLNGIELKLHPIRMVAGVGSKKGVTEDQVFFAIRSALQLLHIPAERLDALATAEIKKDEMGIKRAADKLDLPLNVVSLKKIRNFDHPDCTASPLVKREFGIAGVSEPASLMDAGDNSHLILRKTAFNGVTVAVAVSSG